MSRTTILLADDHPIVRQGLRAMLEAEPDLAVVGEVARGSEVADLVERLKPNVLVLDLQMPDLGGLEVTRQVSQRAPRTKIVILSMYSNEAYVLEALRKGATGYVLKDASDDEVVQAVRAVALGKRYLSAPLSERAIEAYVERAIPDPLDQYHTLTAREREVLHLAAEACSNAEIAARLGISVHTAETYRANIMRKLNLHSQADLIRYALRCGILPLERETPRPGKEDR